MAEENKYEVSNGHKTTLVDFMAKMNESKQEDSTNEESSTEETSEESTEESAEDTSEGETGQVETGSTDVETDDDNSGDSEQEDEAVSTESDQEYEVKGTKVKLKDLLNTYETREEISKRFGEVGLKEKRIREERERIKKEREELDFINQKFDEMREQIMKGNPLAAYQIAMGMQLKEGQEDQDTKKTMKMLIEQSIQMAENWHSMTEDEQKLFMEKQEFEENKRKLDRRDKMRQQQEEQAEVERLYTRVLEEHKMTDAELDAAYDDIQKLPKFKEELDKRDPKQRIEYCATWVLGKRLRSTVEQGIAKVNPGQEKNNDFVLAVLDVVSPNCTIDSVATIVSDAMKLSKNKDSAKVESGASKKDAAPKKVTTPNRAPTETKKAEKESTPVIRSFKDIVSKYS